MNTSPNNANSLGELVRHAREARDFSIRDLADQAEIGRSTLLDLEQGKVASPNPTTLQSLATVLEIDLADIYAAAGYAQPAGLPSFTPYLRSKYADLPDDAKAELEKSFAHIADKYGYDPAGPKPGEDEN